MKISLITTVLNEENSIKTFIDSVLIQSKLPDELMIVDGSSSDRTVSIIKNKALSVKSVKIRVIVKRGNRSVGRNTAVTNSKGDIIAVSDAGCTLDKNWLANITGPFNDKRVSVVAGYYRPITHSIFEKCLSAYTCVMPDKIDPESFLPSSRSIAFKKDAWESVNGYPEKLDTCEDLVFAKKLKRYGFKFKFVKNAVVYWPQRKNISQAFMQFLNYAIGDGQALYIRPQTPLLFARYLMGSILLTAYFIINSTNLLILIYGLLTLYIVWAILKNYKYVRNPMACLYLPILQVTSDIAVIVGMVIGVLKRITSGII